MARHKQTRAKVKRWDTEQERSRRERVQKQVESRPPIKLAALKDRAWVRGYRLNMFRNVEGDWQYTLDGLYGQCAPFPSGGGSDRKLALFAAELAVAALPE